MKYSKYLNIVNKLLHDTRWKTSTRLMIVYDIDFKLN